ncbi:MAG: BofC C-terminal domain-containing protein [Oscillospiraceae bacterium]|nr:BofC C-terminal domain-containing protein [Oscillospiraceae bacterium]
MEKTFAAAVAALLITGAAVLGLFAFFEEPEREAEIAEKTVSLSEPEPEKTVLGVFEGKLALFIGESPYPNIVYDFFVRNLPPEDQSRLFEGISVSSESELESLLEDFMS